MDIASTLDMFMSSAVVEDIRLLFKPALFNIYFALASIPLGFPFAVVLALMKNSSSRSASLFARCYIYAFRGSPLFIQLFMFYSIALAFNQSLWKPMGIDGVVLHPLAVGMSKSQVFRSTTWPNMLRLAWPAYTNEVVFLFHATALVYFTLPVINQQKDLMNKAGELFEKDYNVFLHFSVVRPMRMGKCQN